MSVSLHWFLAWKLLNPTHLGGFNKQYYVDFVLDSGFHLQKGILGLPVSFWDKASFFWPGKIQGGGYGMLVACDGCLDSTCHLKGKRQLPRNLCV